MSEVIVEEQLELTSIVEVVQTKLAKNFTVLLRKLNKQGEDMLTYSTTSDEKINNTQQQLEQLSKTVQHQELKHLQQVQELNSRIDSLQLELGRDREKNKDTPHEIQRLHEELYNTQAQFEEKIKLKQSQFEDLVGHIRTLALEQNRLNDQINKKENKVQAEKIIKETESLKDKNNHFENQLKLATHKIEKMEILSEKASRQQVKKDMQFMKEIEQRVKKELKGSIQSSGSRPLPPLSSSVQNTSSKSSSSPAGTPSFNRTESQMISPTGIGRLPSVISEDQAEFVGMSDVGDSLVRTQVEQVISKWSEKIRSFEVQFKEINENLKVLNRTSINKKTDVHNKQNNNELIKDKINEIKPQLVKLWAKVDTIEDRLSFSERKTDDKLKGLNQLTSLVKQNSIARLDEKLKSLQTQIFTSLKDMRLKLDGKVNQTDYDRYREQMEDRISQINDTLALKTDKLQVKKALFFLQTKIKQIILVITEDEENEKDALLTKKQIKCISCDKQLDKFTGVTANLKGNWDGMPSKEHPPELLGRCGMNYYGTLNKKAKKKLETKQLPSVHKKAMNLTCHNNS